MMEEHVGLIFGMKDRPLTPLRLEKKVIQIDFCKLQCIYIINYNEYFNGRTVRYKALQ